MDLFGYLHGDTSSGRTGIGIDYEQRIMDELSAFATGRVGARWGDDDRLEYDLMGGLRYTW